MANEVRIRASVKDDATKPIGGIRDAFDRLQKQGAKGLFDGVKMAAGFHALNAVGGAVSAVTDFMGESVQAASALNESMGKASVVFGDSADEIEAWAERGAAAFGLSKQAALEAAGTYGNLFQAFGIGQKEATGMSKQLVELAADLASFNNTAIEDALVALRSGLSGETEPLKRYGIAISDARMRTELMAQGVTDLGATLTPLQKSTASYALILKDSALAQGDFERTAAGLANSLRIQTAEMENLKAEVGEGLLPVQLQWEKGNLDLIRSLNLLTNATEMGEMPRDKLEDSLRSLLNILPGLAAPVGDLADGLLEDAEAAEEAERALDGTTVAVEDLSGGVDAAVAPTNDLTGAFRKMRRAASDLGEEVDDLADTISDELFGDAINAGHIAELNETYDELVKQRKEVPKGSREYRILTGDIADNRKSLFDLQLQMKQEEGPEAVLDWLRKQKRLFGDTSGAIQRLIDKYKALAALQGKIAGSPLTIGFASKQTRMLAAGGRYEAGQPRIVGEEGPELDIPDHSGTIVPNHKLGSADGTPVGVTLNVNVSGAALTPAISAQLASQIGPVLVDYMKRRGVLAA